MRKCFNVYPDLPEHLAAALLPSEPPSYTLRDIYAYADGSVLYTPESFWTQSTAVKGSPEAALEEEALKENKEDPMSDSEEETP